MKKCIYCGSDKDLVAELTLTLDDKSRATVDVCQEHADDATIKTAKAKYMERQNQIDELMAKAKELGMTLAPQATAGGLVLMQSAPRQQAQRDTDQQAMRRQAIIEDESDMVDFDDGKLRPMSSASGTAGSYAVEGHRSIDMKPIMEKLGNDVFHGRVRREVVEKASGMPVMIETKKVNGLGTTRIRVVPSTDNDLQRRFKDVANRSKSDYGWDSMRHLGKEGVSVTDCPLCKSDCVVRSGGKEIVCPKCKGKGIMD